MSSRIRRFRLSNYKSWGYLNRTACDVLADMRKCYETRNFSGFDGLIEELQTMCNSMEAGLSDVKDLKAGRAEIKKLKKKRLKLQGQIKKLQKAQVPKGE